MTDLLGSIGVWSGIDAAQKADTVWKNLDAIFTNAKANAANAQKQ